MEKEGWKWCYLDTFNVGGNCIILLLKSLYIILKYSLTFYRRRLGKCHYKFRAVYPSQEVARCGLLGMRIPSDALVESFKCPLGLFFGQGQLSKEGESCELLASITKAREQVQGRVKEIWARHLEDTY